MKLKTTLASIIETLIIVPVAVMATITRFSHPDTQLFLHFWGRWALSVVLIAIGVASSDWLAGKLIRWFNWFRYGGFSEWIYHHIGTPKRCFICNHYFWFKYPTRWWDVDGSQPICSQKCVDRYVEIL